MQNSRDAYPSGCIWDNCTTWLCHRLLGNWNAPVESWSNRMWRTVGIKGKECILVNFSYCTFILWSLYHQLHKLITSQAAVHISSGRLGRLCFLGQVPFPEVEAVMMWLWTRRQDIWVIVPVIQTPALWLNQVPGCLLCKMGLRHSCRSLSDWI